MDTLRFIAIVCLFVYLNHADEDFIDSEELRGPNVCRRIITENITVIVTELVPYEQVRIEWCPAFPPRCRKTVISFKAVNKTEILEKTRTVQECCDGYEKNNETNFCIRNTSSQDGVLLNKLCKAGWKGEFCNEPCSDGHWGVNCLNICKCQNKSKCRNYDGRCVCEFGFTGEFCEQKCPDGFYGNDCIETCNCPNPANFQCHHIYGCRCAEGYSGLSCEEELDEQK